MIRFIFILFLSFLHLRNATGSDDLISNKTFLSSPLFEKNSSDDKENIDPTTPTTGKDRPLKRRRSSSITNGSTHDQKNKKKEPFSRSGTLILECAEDSSTSFVYDTPPQSPNTSFICDSGSFFLSPTPSMNTGGSFTDNILPDLTSVTFLEHLEQNNSNDPPNIPLPFIPELDDTPGTIPLDVKNRLKIKYKLSDKIIAIAEILNVSLRIDSGDPVILMEDPRIKKFLHPFSENPKERKEIKTLLLDYKNKRPNTVRSIKYGDHTIDPETIRIQDGRLRTKIKQIKKQNKTIFRSPADKDKNPYFPPLTDDERREQRHAMRERMRTLNTSKNPETYETLEEMEARLLAPLIQFIHDEQEKWKTDPINYKKIDIESFNLIFYDLFKDSIQKGNYYTLLHDDGYIWIVPRKLNLDWENAEEDANKDLLSWGRSPVSSKGEPMEAHHTTMTGPEGKFYKTLKEMMAKEKKTFLQLNLSEEEQFKYGCPVILLSDDNHQYNIHPHNILSQVDHPDRSAFDTVRKAMNIKISAIHSSTTTKSVLS